MSRIILCFRQEPNLRSDEVAAPQCLRGLVQRIAHPRKHPGEAKPLLCCLNLLGQTGYQPLASGDTINVTRLHPLTHKFQVQHRKLHTADLP